MKTTIARVVAGLVAVAVLGALGGTASIAVPPAFGTTALVSASASGAVADGDSLESTISADGRYVAFTSGALNLTPTGGAQFQVYRKDLVTGEVKLVSVDASDPKKGGDWDSQEPSISADGRFVAFSSSAANLQTLPVNRIRQVFVRDLQLGVTRLISVRADRTRAANNQSENPFISADGSTVAFDSLSSDMVPGVTGNGWSLVYKTAAAPTAGSAIELVSSKDGSSPSAPVVVDGGAGNASVSADGSSVAFESNSADLVPGSNPAKSRQIFVRAGSSTQLVSRAAGTAVGGDRDSGAPSISSDGQRIAYSSRASDLGTPSTGTISQILLRDLRSADSTLVSVGRDGTSPANAEAFGSAISADGATVAFVSIATDLTDVETHGSYQVYLRTVRGTSMVSTTDHIATGGGAEPSTEPSISADGRYVAFSSAAQLLPSGPVGGARSLIFVRGAEVPTVERVAGADRFATSAEISARTFSPGVGVVYVASGVVYADALAASATAGPQFAPVLLVEKTAIPASIAAELRRLKPASIVVLGGVNSVADSVATALKGYASKVTRIGGADRYEVAVNVSKSVFGSGGIAVTYIASGENFADALSGSAAAGHLAGPVLLVPKGSVPALVEAELKRTAPAVIVVLGGTNSVAEAVVDQLKTIAPTARVYGTDRYGTSASVSADAFPTGAKTVYVASGASFPDALSGSVAAITKQAPVLLVAPDSIPTAVAQELDRLDPTRIVVLGGPASVSPAVEQLLGQYVVG